MKVYFTCSTAKFQEYRANYYAIRDFLVSEDHILTRDWLAEADDRIGKNLSDLEDIKQIYKECMKAIDDADVVIIEDTVSNFSTGHQITVALQRMRPTLVLWSEPKHKHFKNTFIQGVDSEYLEATEYTLENYQEIIHKFLKKYADANVRNRFHLVLSEVERKYLDWGHFHKQHSRTKMIREAIRNNLDKDEAYQKYLKSE